MNNNLKLVWKEPGGLEIWKNNEFYILISNPLDVQLCIGDAELIKKEYNSIINRRRVKNGKWYRWNEKIWIFRVT